MRRFFNITILIIIITFLLTFLFKINMLLAFVNNSYNVDNILQSKYLKSDTILLESIREIISGYNSNLLRTININIKNGFIIISGIVKTIGEREKTISLIKTIKGVKGIIDYTILVPFISRDNDIKNIITSSFLHNPSVYAPRIQIKVFEGIVILSGFAANYWEKEEAGNVAKSIDGVVEVKNDLIVDSNIKLKNIDTIDSIKAMLSADEYLFNNTITVKIDDGKLILQGIVDTSFEKSHAVKKIRQFEIQEIDNQLLVEGNQIAYAQNENYTINDSDIKKAIQDILLLDERIETKNIDISVENGDVTLQGTVNDIYQKKFIEQDILNISGVQFVNNILKFQNETRDDMSIIGDVERLLSYEPNFVNSNITATCNAGKVFLKGTTDSIINKAYAEKIIGRVNGVQKVSNLLQIESTRDSIKTNSSELLNWGMDVGNNTFQIYVDRYNKTIFIRGEAQDFEQKNNAEALLKLRAPENFMIINQIDIISKSF